MLRRSPNASNIRLCDSRYLGRTFLNLVAHAAAQQENVGLRIELSQTAQPSQQALQSNQTTADFTVRPSVTSSTLGAGLQTLQLTVFCINLSTGQITGVGLLCGSAFGVFFDEELSTSWPHG